VQVHSRGICRPRTTDAARESDPSGGRRRLVRVKVTLKNGSYAGGSTVKQTNFGIQPPGKAGIRAKGEVRIEFEVSVAS
jgi:hypothetical protein